MGVYPLLLVAITYFLVKLHDQYSIVVYLWRPCYRVFSCFSSKLNIKTSLVQAFATFILLSYVKICNVSFDILTPAKKYLRPDGSEVDKQYWYYNGSLEFFGKDHIPYAALAIAMSLLFNILPLLLLILYPFPCFRNILCFLKLESGVLNIFMDTFYGCYRTESRYYSLFAAVYIVLRIVNQFFLSAIETELYFFYAGYATIVALSLVATIRPYTNKCQNIADITLLLCLLTYYLFRNSLYQILFTVPEAVDHFFNTSTIIEHIAMLLPGMYLLFVLIRFFLRRCHAARLRKIIMNSFLNRDMEESLPYRLQQSNECTSLIEQNSIHIIQMNKDYFCKHLTHHA